jgi:hypothetical protein
MSSYESDSILSIRNYSTMSLSSSSSESIIQDDISESSSDEDNSMEYDSETEEMIERIYFHEQEFLDSEKEDSHYYIGNNRVSYDKQYILYANSITPTTFFQFNIQHLLSYLLDYSIFPTLPNIDIMQLSILDDSTYTVVLKTYWLRLIQRHWKKTYTQRKDALNKRRNIRTIRYFEIHGRYPDNSYNIPHLQGMLCCYSKNYLSNVIK